MGNQIVAIIHHVAIGSDNSRTFGNYLHSRRIERTIKAGGVGVGGYADDKGVAAYWASSDISRIRPQLFSL